MSSRLNAFADANGAGILTRVVSVCRAYTVLMSFFYIRNTSPGSLLKIISKLYLVFVIIACFLSGSRGSVLIFATSFFFYITIYKESNPKLIKLQSKYESKIVVVLLIFVIGVNTIKSGDVFTGIGEFGVRLLCYGDTYFYAYPNQLIEEIDNSQPFKSIFSSFLGFFRIYSYEELPTPIGLDLFHFFRIMVILVVQMLDIILFYIYISD